MFRSLNLSQKKNTLEWWTLTIKKCVILLLLNRNSYIKRRLKNKNNILYLKKKTKGFWIKAEDKFSTKSINIMLSTKSIQKIIFQEQSFSCDMKRKLWKGRPNIINLYFQNNILFDLIGIMKYILYTRNLECEHFAQIFDYKKTCVNW